MAKKIGSVYSTGEKDQALDIATGTGDQAISIARSGDHILHVTGIDLARMMLEKGKIKIEKLGLADR